MKGTPKWLVILVVSLIGATLLVGLAGCEAQIGERPHAPVAPPASKLLGWSFSINLQHHLGPGVVLGSPVRLA